MDLGLHLCTFVMSYISFNPSLKNETNNILREACVEHDTTAHSRDQRKVKIKKSNIEVENISTE